MSEDKKPFPDVLRKLAEARASAEQAAHTAALSPDETQKLLHELRVHQIELQMQNDELRTSQAGLEDAWARYFDLYDLAPVGYLTVNEKGLVLEANLTFAGLLGVTKDRLKNKIFTSFLLPEDADPYYLFHKELFKTCEPQSCELRMLRANALPLWVRMDAAFAMDAHGMPLCRAVVIDISGRKAAEEALSASETQYRRLFESAKDGILILNAETGMVVDVNPYLIELLGFSKESFLNKEIWDLGFFKDIIANQNKFMELQQKEYVRYDDLPLEAANGRKIAVEFVSNIYQVNHHRVIQCNIRNITKRKQAEDALRESERRLSEAQKMAQLGSWKWDVRTGNVEWSEEVFNIFRLDPKAFTPHIDSILALSPWPEDHERDKELIRRAMETHEKGTYEQRFLLPDKSIGYYYSTFQGQYAEGGDLVSIIGTVMDITERKRAEEALRESEEKFRNLFNNAEVGMFRTRLDGSEFLDSNDKYLSILGMTREEIIGKPSMIVWADPKEREEMIKTLKAQGRVDGLEFKLRNKAGEVRSCLTSLKLYPETGILEGSIIDITERKQAEEELRESEAKYRSLANHVPQKIFVKDLDLLYVSCNRSYAEDLGRNPGDFPGKDDFMFYPRELAEKFRADDKRIMATGKAETIEEKVLLRGKEAWVRTIKTPVRKDNGEVCGVLGIFEDITEHKRAEEALRLGEKKYRLLFEKSGDAIFLADPETRMIVDCNKKAEQLLGCSRQEILVLRADQLHPADRQEKTMQEFKEQAAGRLETIETEILRKDGERRQVSINSAVVEMEGRPYLLGVFRDVNEAKKAEEETRKHSQELEVFYKASFGREERILELKQEVTRLKKEMGK